jgi:hypothetical protein
MPSPTIDAITVADPPEAWEAAGFTVDADGTCRVGHVRIELVGRDAGKRILGWRLRDIPEGTTDIDGLPTTVAGTEPVAEPAQHANGALLIDHIVISSPDVDRTIKAFEAIGIDARRTRHIDSSQYGFEARQVFFTLGEVILELIGADQPSGDDPARFFGLAHTVADIDAAAALLGPSLPNVKDAVQPGRRIATLRHKEVGVSIATAFMSPEPQ